MDRVVGIDLGTTNSVIAYYEQGQTVVIQNAEGHKTTPSVVYFKSSDEVIVGELAKRNAVTSPKQAIRSVKRFMGGRYSESGVKLRGVSYDVVPGPDDSLLVDVGFAKMSPERISSEVLKRLRQSAEDFFGEPVTRAVITVPAYFNDSQRAATKRAGEIAGLEVQRIINEPTAAALAYGIDRNVAQKIAVFDLGGGTFDVSILEITKGVFEVLSTCGDTFLGGDNIDQLILDDIVSRFRSETGTDLTTDLSAVQRIREAAERAKCELSAIQETVVSLPYIAASEAGPLHLDYSISRLRLQELMKPLMPRLEACCNQALADANLETHELSQVLLVGGSTRIPGVQDWVRDFFGLQPNHSLNPDEAVAAGAAVQASIVSGSIREVLLLDVTPLSLGIEVSGGLFNSLIPRNSSIPTSVSKNFTTQRDNQTSVRVHILQGERKIARENFSLGTFNLSGIPAAPKGIAEVRVTLSIDANGILEVSAMDVTSGASKSITIENLGAVSSEEAERLVKMAEKHSDADNAFLRLQFLREHSQRIADNLQRLIKEAEDMLAPEQISTIREAILKFDLSVADDNVAEIEMSYGRLKELAQEHSSRLVMFDISVD